MITEQIAETKENPGTAATVAGTAETTQITEEVLPINISMKVGGLTIGRIIELLEVIKNFNNVCHSCASLEISDHESRIHVTYFWTKEVESTVFYSREGCNKESDVIYGDKNLELAEEHMKLIMRVTERCPWMHNPYREEDEEIDAV